LEFGISSGNQIFIRKVQGASAQSRTPFRGVKLRLRINKNSVVNNGIDDKVVTIKVQFINLQDVAHGVS
jgi:hypothetical protein